MLATGLNTTHIYIIEEKDFLKRKILNFNVNKKSLAFDFLDCLYIHYIILPCLYIFLSRGHFMSGGHNLSRGHFMSGGHFLSRSNMFTSKKKKKIDFLEVSQVLIVVAMHLGCTLKKYLVRKEYKSKSINPYTEYAPCTPRP